MILYFTCLEKFNLFLEMYLKILIVKNVFKLKLKLNF